MSEALDYLLAARPEAMKAYFRFLREAGTHLDPKMRAMISIITKVAAQTEDGFRQYLSRGLQAGLTANEILDGILMAFPALGLTRITWAMDLLIEMDIPAFRLESLQNPSGQWHRIIELSAIPAEGTICVSADGRDVFVSSGEGVYKVFDSHCPHQVTHIPALALDGERITCPRHGWVFDARSGSCLEKGDRGLRELESRLDDGWLIASW